MQLQGGDAFEHGLCRSFFVFWKLKVRLMSEVERYIML